MLILCNDAERKGVGRLRALEEVCHRENITLVGALPHDNNFYALPTRRSEYTLGVAIAWTLTKNRWGNLFLMFEKLIIK